MFSCLQLRISWTNLPWLVEKGEKSAGWSADWSGGWEVSGCRVGEGLHWNMSRAKVSGWAQHAPLDKISVHQCMLLSLSHFFLLLTQHFTDTVEPRIETGLFYRAPIYRWPIIGRSLFQTHIMAWVFKSLELDTYTEMIPVLFVEGMRIAWLISGIVIAVTQTLGLLGKQLHSLFMVKL